MHLLIGFRKSKISIHTLRVEGDQAKRRRASGKSSFQSTPSAWRVTRHRGRRKRRRCISIHTLRVEGDSGNLRRQNCFNAISIHTLRVEGHVGEGSCRKIDGISIHTLRGEGDLRLFCPYKWSARFQSTPSAWRVTSIHLPNRPTI